MSEYQAHDGISIPRLLEVLRRRRIWMVLPPILITCALAAYLWHTPNRYRAEATLAAEPRAVAGLAAARDPSTPMNVQDYFRLVREVVLNESVLEEFISRFDLRESGLVKTTEDAKALISLKPEAIDTFIIAFECLDARQAAEGANWLADLFVERTAESLKRTEESTNLLLDHEIEELRTKLAALDGAIREHKQRVPELSGQLAINLKLLETLETRFQMRNDTIAEDEARRLAAVKELKGLEAQGALNETAPIRVKDAAEQRIEQLRIQLNELQARGYTPQHPDVVSLHSEMRSLEPSASNPRAPARREMSPLYSRHLQLKADVEAIEHRLKSARSQQRRTQAEILALRGRLHSAPGEESALADLLRQQQEAQLRYQALLEKEQQADLSANLRLPGSAVVFRVTESARPPLKHRSPQRARILLLGLLASLGIGFATAMLVEQVDTSFSTLEQLRNQTGLPVMGAVPAISGRLESCDSGVNSPGANGADPLARARLSRIVTLSARRSVPSEQFEVLATRLQTMTADRRGRLLAVTSAVGGEGKSVTAINLAVALSRILQGGVLLLDGDLRRPSVRNYLGLPAGDGLAQLLIEPDRSWEACLDEVGQLKVLKAGKLVDHPGALLASPRARTLLTELRRRFAYVIVDSPPLLPVADSHALAEHSDGVLFVVRARRTPADVVERAVESCHRQKILGVVLNDVDYNLTRYAYAYEYYKRNHVARI